MKIEHRLLLVGPLAVLLAGCGHNDQLLAPSPAGSSDAQQAAVSAEVARHPELVEDGVYDSQTQTDATTGAAAAIDPLFFWRQIVSVERAYEFAFADTDSTGRPTTAIVTVHKRLGGWFNVLAADTTAEGNPTDGHVVKKELHDHWVRRVLLKRVSGVDGEIRPWRIAAVSGVKITSRDGETRLASLRVQSGDLDTTVTDPLAFWRLRRILRFQPDAQVMLTATTGRDDDVVVLYAGDRRFRFHSNGDGTYVGTWTATALSGVHHLGVNALSHGTLYDDQAPYDSQTWIVPYIVVPTELADLAS
jgi:hypothetical protein